MEIVIIGCGISGIIAKRIFGNSAIVFESSSDIGHTNHGVMRTDDGRIAHILGVPIQTIKVRKSILYRNTILTHPTFAASNSYSLKVSGCLDDRSIISINGGEPIMRYLFDFADLHGMMGDGIYFNSTVIGIGSLYLCVNNCPKYFDACISTIPLPKLLAIIGDKVFDRDVFKYQPVYVDRFKLALSSVVNQTIYVADRDASVYRVTLQFRDLIVESVNEFVDNGQMKILLDALGIRKDDLICDIHNKYIQPYGKILPIDDTLRKTIVLYLTEKYGIYSLGRFALWKPQVKMRDTIDDVLIIRKMLEIDQERRKYEGKIAAINPKSS